MVLDMLDDHFEYEPCCKTVNIGGHNIVEAKRDHESPKLFSE